MPYCTVEELAVVVVVFAIMIPLYWLVEEER